MSDLGTLIELGGLNGSLSIVLHAGAREAEFETLMREEVFSAVAVLRRAVFGTKHILLKADPQGGGQPQYLWLILGEVMGGKREVNNTEVQITQDVLEKIAAYGTLSTLRFLGSRESGTGRPPQDVGWQ